MTLLPILATVSYRYLAVGQGLYFLVTGIWPLVHLRSFLKMTGPKVDLWLVKTVGILVAVMGAAISIAGIRKRTTREIRLLALGSAAGLATIDLIYVAKRRIPLVYLLDAFIELAFIAGWFGDNTCEPKILRLPRIQHWLPPLRKPASNRLPMYVVKSSKMNGQGQIGSTKTCRW